MVPVIDLEQVSAEQVQAVAAACRDWGFFQVTHFGIPASLITQVRAASAQFFSLPAAAKRQVLRSEDNPFGFYDRELTKNLRDRKEIFDASVVEPTQWPAQPVDFRAVMERYSKACHELAQRILALCCEGLVGDGNILAGHFGPDHSGFLRLNYYPREEALAADVTSPGPYGISEHTDAGALTLLLQDEVPGLQVYRGDAWHDVPPVSGALTINIGDMLQVWSNGRYRAPLHRVTASAAQARSTVAYFFNPAYSTVVSPLPRLLGPAEVPHYRPVPWQEFRQLRAQGDYGDYGQEVQISDYRV